MVSGTVTSMRFGSRRKALPAQFQAAAKHAGLSANDLAQPAVELNDGNWLLPASAGPVLLTAEEPQLVGYWYEIQHVAWKSRSRELQITWVDPQREPYRAITASRDPGEFMAATRDRVDYHTFATLRRVSDEGTVIIAAVRRRLDGELFSTLVAYGPLDEAGQLLADQTEAEVREQAGLNP